MFHLRMVAVVLVGVMISMVSAQDAEHATKDPATSTVVGTWAIESDGTRGDSVLRLNADGSGLWVTEQGEVARDAFVTWASGDGWIAMTGRDNLVFDLTVVDGGRIDAVARVSRGEHVIVLRRTNAPRLLRLLPGHDGAPEQLGVATSIIGFWITSPSDSGGRGLYWFDASGLGGVMGLGASPPIGTMLRWARDGDGVEATTSERVPLRFRVEDDVLILLDQDEGEIVMERTENPTMRGIIDFAFTPDAPEPPRRRTPPEEQAAYFESGATEAMISLLPGDEFFRIGGEAFAPEEVRKALAEFRIVGTTVLSQLDDPMVRTGPDGRSVVISGLDLERGIAVTHLWHDWREPDTVEVFGTSYSHGGRFLSDDAIYLGSGIVLDRTGRRLFNAPPAVSAYTFDVARMDRWIGIKNNGNTLAVGDLMTADPAHERAVEKQCVKVAWVNDEAMYAVADLAAGGIQIFDEELELVTAIQDEWRLGPQIGPNRFFVSRKNHGAGVLNIDDKGAMTISDEWKPSCRLDYGSPSGRYVSGLTSRRHGDRDDVGRSSLADPDVPLPPRPPYARSWVSWTD